MAYVEATARVLTEFSWSTVSLVPEDLVLRNGFLDFIMDNLMNSKCIIIIQESYIESTITLEFLW